MSTHDKYALPPLPKPAMNEGDTALYAAFAGSQLTAYAIAAIEADRKRRGEPVAWRYLTPTGWHATTDAARALGVAEHHTVEPLFAAPQPAEPMKSCLTFKYDDKRDCLYVFCDNNEPTEAEENEQGILLWRACSDGRLVGVTIPNFIGPMSNR